MYTDGATTVTLYLAAATDNREPDPLATSLERVKRAKDLGFEQLRDRHIQDFEPLMRRCSLNLGQGVEQPIPQRIAALKSGKDDPALCALYFTFGRYLLAAGGRSGSSALNLQGIWCKEFAPMWDSKYTTNINVQMLSLIHIYVRTD